MKFFQNGPGEVHPPEGSGGLYDTLFCRSTPLSSLPAGYQDPPSRIQRNDPLFFEPFLMSAKPVLLALQIEGSEGSISKALLTASSNSSGS